MSDDDSCDACAPGSENAELKCSQSQRPCGHHCNCVMIHDYCHWCETEWVEDGVEMPKLMREVFRMVALERAAQEARYTDNDSLQDGTGPDTFWLLPYTSGNATQVEQDLRDEYEQYNRPTWSLLVREEIAEAFKESDPDRLQAELTQVAALAVAWIERIRSRT